MFATKIRPGARVFQSMTIFRANDSAKILTRNFPRPVQAAVESRRSIFSDEFVGLDKFAKFTSRVRLATADEEGFKKNMNELFAKSGLQSLFTEDILKLIELAETDEDFDLVKNILLECFRDEIRAVNTFKPLYNFTTRCLLCLKVSQARTVWNDEQVQKSGLLDTHKFRLTYLTLLYRCENFDELIVCYKNFKSPVLSESTIAMAALSKIGTSEAFCFATEVMRQNPIAFAERSKSSGGRITALYAYFAHRLGHYGPAFDILTDPRRVGRPSKFTTNLKILILTDVGRLKDAMLLIRSELLPTRDALNEEDKSKDFGLWKPIVCLDVMKKLTQAVRDSNDADLSKELMTLCKALDSAAELTDETIEQMVFESITLSESKKRKRQQQRPQKEAKRNLYND